jgi:Ca2+-binding RTX toxin-like protein
VTWDGDYVAGGPDADKIVGQRGDDTIQGGGSIDLDADEDAQDQQDVNAYRSPDDGKLVTPPSAEDLFGPGSDSDDYVEGNRGDDLVFGNLGQDDIIGGSSILLGLDNPEGLTPAGDRSRDQRVDGTNMLFGGAGTRIDRFSDGNDVPFGDLGNDWIVGSTGQDHAYGGRGDDLLNADDFLDTLDENATPGSEGENELPDGPEASYEDIAYGGAGRDVLIANTGGDRLIDWVGEFNSYIVPFAPFGAATVSRTLQPQLPEYVQNLAASDGIDRTRGGDVGNVDRNGEPDGELGTVLQKDFDWQDQTGAPDDPQPGNLPGGARDGLRSADFNNGQASGFVPDSGNWEASGGRYEVSPSDIGGDAASVFFVDHYLPSYFERRATINAGKPSGGLKSNAYLIRAERWHGRAGCRECRGSD